MHITNYIEYDDMTSFEEEGDTPIFKATCIKCCIYTSKLVKFNNDITCRHSICKKC